MFLSDGWMVCEELDERRSQVEIGRSVFHQSRQEHRGLEHGQGDQLPPAPQHVGHRDVHGEDVEHREDADGDLLGGHELHDGVVQLGHVGHQVPVRQLHPFRDSGGAGAVGQHRDVVRRDGDSEILTGQTCLSVTVGPTRTPDHPGPSPTV